MADQGSATPDYVGGWLLPFIRECSFGLVPQFTSSSLPNQCSCPAVTFFGEFELSRKETQARTLLSTGGGGGWGMGGILYPRSGPA